MLEHKLNPNATYTEQVMYGFHEFNELYDGTLNEVHHLLYHTNISTNSSLSSCFMAFRKVKLSFVLMSVW